MSGTGKSTILITNGNAMSMLALSGWLAKHGHCVRKVYVTEKLPSAKSNLHGLKEMLLGSGVGYSYLKVWTNRLLPFQLKRMGVPASVSDLISTLGLASEVQGVKSVNSESVLNEINALEVDYLVSFSATQRFSEDIINAVGVAALNVHYGALPAYAGLSPYYWHLHNHEPEFGVTLHRINSKLDAGPIIDQTRDGVGEVKSALGLALKMASHVSPLLCRFYDGETTLASAKPQPTTGRSYFRHPSLEQVREFKRSGYAFLDSASKRDVRAAATKLKPTG